jgi:hypothetical protein
MCQHRNRDGERETFRVEFVYWRMMEGWNLL